MFHSKGMTPAWRVSRGLKQSLLLMLVAVSMVGFWATTGPDLRAAECPAGITPIDDETVAYRDRGARCEGLFVQPVAAAGLTIMGFHRHPPEITDAPDGQATDTVALDVRSTPGVNVRALSTRRRLYYRMDATVPESGVFQWQGALFGHPRIGLRGREIVFLGCDGACERPAPRLHPVSVAGRDREPPEAGRLTLVLMAGVELEELHVFLRAATGELLLDGRNELVTVLPAATPVALLLDELEPGQEYAFEAIAVPRGSVALDRVAATLVVQ